VHDADGLADETMLAFAGETRLSETTFVQAGDDDADYRNRIWMTTGELPFAGHPSLGTAVAVALAQGRRSASYVQRTGAGLQPLEVELDGHLARASMLQEPAVFGDGPEAGTVLAAVGLEVRDADPELPPQVVSTGVPQLLAPVRDQAALGRCVPDAPRLAGLLAATGAVVLYAIARTATGAQARAFFTGRGGAVEEDPATGSAAGPLMAYLHRRSGRDSIVIEQGAAIDRPSRLEASIEGDRVRVGGHVVVLATGSVFL
jgi:trans-2,3-dihydro-3-hydroxyanthranilate isomerase